MGVGIGSGRCRDGSGGGSGRCRGGSGGIIFRESAMRYVHCGLAIVVFHCCVCIVYCASLYVVHCVLCIVCCVLYAVRLSLIVAFASIDPCSGAYDCTWQILHHGTCIRGLVPCSGGSHECKCELLHHGTCIRFCKTSLQAEGVDDHPWGRIINCRNARGCADLINRVCRGFFSHPIACTCSISG